MLKGERFYSLQAFRAAAAILVVFFHASMLSQYKLNYLFLNNRLWFGYVGIDCFFVLSGFIIYTVHRQDWGLPARLQPYLLKRFLRVYPIYWLVTLAVIPVYLLNPDAGAGHEVQPNVILSSILLLPRDKNPTLGVAWTLTYEIWFYLLFGLAIRYGKSFARWGSLFWATSILVAWSANYLHPAGFSMAQLNFPARFFLDSRNLEFLLGCVSAYLVLNFKIRKAPALVFVGMLIFTLAGPQDSSLKWLGDFRGFLIYGMASALIVVGAASHERHATLRFPRWVTYLGDASYSIYLVHFLTLSLLNKIFLRLSIYGFTGLFLGVNLLILLATGTGCLMYSFAEKPLLAKLRNRLLRDSPSDPAYGPAKSTKGACS